MKSLIILLASLSLMVSNGNALPREVREIKARPNPLANQLAPGSYDLVPGQYNLAVAGASATPTPTPSATPTPSPTATPSPTPTPIPGTFTIGETRTDLEYDDGGNAGLVLAQAAVLPQIGTLQSLSFYVIDPPAGTLALGFYDSSGPSNGPGRLAASTAQFTAAAGWNTVPVAIPIALQPGTYWLAYLPSSSDLHFKLTQASGQYQFANATALPAAFPTPKGGGTGHWSFYATLMAGGNPTPTPTPTPTPVPTPTPPPVAGGTFRFFGGVFDLPSSNADHYVNAPYTENTQNSLDALYNIVTTDPNTFKWDHIDKAMNFAKAHNVPWIWYCGYLNWAEGQGFPGNFGYSGAAIKTLLTNLITQAKARYGESDLNKYCYFNYSNEALNAAGGTGPWASAFGGKGSSGCDWVINTGKVIRQVLPNAKIGLNDYGVEDVNYMHQYYLNSRLSQFLSWLPKLKEAGVLDWVGYEGYNLDSQTSAGLTDSLNQSGAYAPVIYTEFSPGSYDWFWTPGTASDPAQNANATWSDGLTSVQGSTKSNQIAAWKRLVPLLAENKHCGGIVGPWVGGPAGGSAIFSGSPPVDKPAMTWLKSYLPTIQ